MLTQNMRAWQGNMIYSESNDNIQETLKDLSRVYGRQIMVLNYNEKISVNNLLHNFIGALSQGAFLVIENLNLKITNEKSLFNSQIQDIMYKLK